MWLGCPLAGAGCSCSRRSEACLAWLVPLALGACWGVLGASCMVVMCGCACLQACAASAIWVGWWGRHSHTTVRLHWHKPLRPALCS